MGNILRVVFLLMGLLVSAQPTTTPCSSGETRLDANGRLYGCVESTWKKLSEDVNNYSVSFSGPSGTTQLTGSNIFVKEGLSYAQLANIGSPAISIAGEPHALGKLIYSTSLKHFYQGIDNGLWQQVDNTQWCSTQSASYSQNFTRNNCLPGYQPETVSYSVTRSAYACSTISQSNADADAYNIAYNSAVYAVNTEGQAYANANGVCYVPPTINSFDYLVIRYWWTSNNGQDFDSATGFVNMPGNSINNKSVGYKPGGKVLTLGSPEVLNFIGDNTQSGYESVLISYANIPSNGPANTPYELHLAGNWFNARYDGNVQVELVAYRGGSMTKNTSNYLWENSGGR